MAEDRAIEALVEGCRSGNVYSGWTTVNALLNKRYFSWNPRGKEVEASAFILKAFEKAAIPYLEAEIAANLSCSLLLVFEHFSTSLSDDFADSKIREMLRLFQSVVVASPYIHEDPSERDEMPRFADAITPGARTMKHLVLWYTASLRFCEAIALDIFEKWQCMSIEVKFVLPEERIREDMRSVRICTYRWCHEAFHAAMRLAVCFSKLEGSTPSDEPPSRGDGEGSGASALRSLMLPKAWLRAMKWSIYAEDDSTRRANMKCLWNSLWKYIPSLYHKQTTLAMFICDTLSCSDSFRRRNPETAPKDTSAGADGKLWLNYPPIFANEAIQVVHFAREEVVNRIERELLTYSGDPDVFIGDTAEAGMRFHNWNTFLMCFICILRDNISRKANLAGTDWPHNASDNQTKVYRKLCNRLCGLFSETLKDLPFLNWEAVAAAHA